MSLIIELTNDGTGTETDSHYDYQVWVNELLLARGRVEHHSRASGWEQLIRRVADQETCRRQSSFM